MGKLERLGLLAVLVSAVAQDASWWRAVGGGSDVLASGPQDASEPVLSGALNDLVSRESSHGRQVNEARIENAKLTDKARVLQQQVHSSEESAARFTKIAKLARGAEEAARVSYDQRIKSVVQKYESEAHVMSQTVAKFRKQRADANRTATLAERGIHQERRHAHAVAKYILNTRFKLNQTARELLATRRLLHQFNRAGSDKEARLSTKLGHIEKADAVLEAQLGDARQALENRSKELVRFQASSMVFANRTQALNGALSDEQLRAAKAQDFGKETARELGMLRASVQENQPAIERKLKTMSVENNAVYLAAQKNASEASIALRAAEEAHEVLSVVSESRLNHVRADSAASSERAAKDEKELAKTKAELDLLRASFRHEQMQSQHRALALRDVKGRLARDGHVLNATQHELSAATALVHEQEEVRKSISKSAAELKLREEVGLTNAHAQIAKDKSELEDFRRRLSARTQEVNATHNDLDVALGLIRDEQDFHTKVMNAVARMKRDDAQKDRVRSSEVATLNAKVEATRKVAGAKNHKLSLTREAWRKANASLAGAANQLDLIRSELREQATQASNNVTMMTERLSADNARLSAARDDAHDKDVKLDKAHAEISEFHEQLRVSASVLARVASERASLSILSLELENQTVLERAQAHLEHVSAVAAAAAKDRALNATSQELAQAQLQEKLLHAQGIAMQAEKRAQQTEASEREGKLSKAEITSAQEMVVRAHLEDQLTLAHTELMRLSATHVELAKELGVTLENFEAGAVEAVRKVHLTRESLGPAKEELSKDREELVFRDHELNQTRAQVEVLRHTISMSGPLRARLSEAEETLSKFRQEFVDRDAAVLQANKSLLEVLASVSGLHKERSKLDWTSKELDALDLALGRKGRELNSTRAQQSDAIRSLKQLQKSKATVASKLAVTSKNVNLTRTELAADDGELSLMHKELAKTMAAVEDLKGMDAKLGVAQKELKSYRDASSGKRSKTSKIRGQAAAAGIHWSAIKDIEQMRAELHADGVQLASVHIAISKNSLESRPASVDTVRTRRLGLQR